MDAVAIDHTKMVDVKGGALYRRLKAEGVSFGEAQCRTRAVRRVRPPSHAVRPACLPKRHPRSLGFLLTHMFESLKIFARQQKKLKRYWHKRAAAAR